MNDNDELFEWKKAKMYWCCKAWNLLRDTQANEF